MEDLSHFKDTYVLVHENLFTIGEFASEQKARNFLSKLDLSSLRSLWYVMVNGILNRTRQYLTTKKDKKVFLLDLELLVNSASAIERLNKTRNNNFEFKDSIVKTNGKFYIKIEARPQGKKETATGRR